MKKKENIHKTRDEFTMPFENYLKRVDLRVSKPLEKRQSFSPTRVIIPFVEEVVGTTPIHKPIRKKGK